MAPSRLDRRLFSVARWLTLTRHCLDLVLSRDLFENRIPLFGIMAWGRKMGMQDIITTKLMAAFAPESLHVEDESHLHQGHAGHRPGGESHFRLYIVSSAFKGKSRLERHRMINTALANEMKGRVHALAIHAQAPGES
jgi:BolA protein